MILMLSVRVDGADKRLAPPVVSEGMMDLVRLEVDFGPCNVDLEREEIAEAHSLIAEPLLGGTSLSVQ